MIIIEIDINEKKKKCSGRPLERSVEQGDLYGISCPNGIDYLIDATFDAHARSRELIRQHWRLLCALALPFVSPSAEECLLSRSGSVCVHCCSVLRIRLAPLRIELPGRCEDGRCVCLSCASPLARLIHTSQTFASPSSRRCW